MIVNSAIEYRKWVKDKEVRPDVDEKSIVIIFRVSSFTNTCTIDQARSELYGAQQQTFVAPHTCCDRVADNRTAWVHFEKLFNN